MHNRRLRFGLATGGHNITYINLCDAINVATAATTAYQLFDFVRVVGVEMWTIAAVGLNATLTLNFSGQTPGLVGDSDQYTDTSMGIEPAHIRARPSPKCTASTWQPGSNSGTAFSVKSDTAGIIDVILQYRVNEAYLPATVANAPAGLSAGNIYYRSLDGVALGTFTPLGVVNVD